MVVFRQSGVFQKKWLYSGKVVSFWSNLAVFRKLVVYERGGCFRVKGVVFEPGGSVRANWLYPGQKWLYSGKVVVFVQSGSIPAKVVVFG